MRTSAIVAAVTLTAALSAPALAVQAGRASGTLTVDGKATTLAFATSGTAEDLFDSSKSDTIVVLSDRALEEVSPDDEVELHMRARSGKLVALALRLDGSKLVNVAVHASGLEGVELLPGVWFTSHGGAAGAGSLGLATRSFDGHSFACSVEYSATPAKEAPELPQAPITSRAVEPTPTLPPASESSIDPKAMAALLVGAMMQKDEEQAYQLVKSGADPNLRDQYGVPVLNWAVMVCMPRVVKALVDRGADLTVQRAPGLTILQEAGACPEAAKILRAAGAR